MTIKSIIDSYRGSIRLLARCPIKKIDPPTGNIQKFRVPNKVGDEKNRPYKVIYYDFKEPIRVNDDRKIKKVKKKISDEEHDVEDKDLKAKILSATCAMARHTTLEVVILNEQFYISRAQMTIKTIINSYRYLICLLARCPTMMIEPPTGNIQKFQTQINVGTTRIGHIKLFILTLKVLFELMMTEK